MVDTAIREAVGVFHDERSLQSAVDALLIAGFDRSYLSLLAAQSSIEAKLGHRFEKVSELEDEPEVPTQAYIGIDSRTEGKGVLVGVLFYVGACAAAGAVVASGGTAAAALIAGAVAGGGGGLIGAAFARFLEQRHAHRLQEQLDRGGLVLWVRTPTREDEQRAVETLRANGGGDVHVHDLPKPHYAQEGGVSHDMSFMKSLGM
jgi:hypothetical protein